MGCKECHKGSFFSFLQFHISFFCREMIKNHISIARLSIVSQIAVPVIAASTIGLFLWMYFFKNGALHSKPDEKARNLE